MRKIISIFSIALITLSFLQIPANGAVKAGSSCKTAGITSVVSGKTFTCIKSGRKFIWNKGVEIDYNWYAWNFRINSKGILERKESNFGKWSSSPSRKGQIVDPIRLKAFSEIQSYMAKRNRKIEFPSIKFSSNVNSDVKRTIDTYFAQSLHFFYDEIPSNANLETIISTEKDDEFFKTNILEIEKGSAYGLETYQRNKNMFEQFNGPNPLNSSGGGSVGSTSLPGLFLYLGAVCSCFKGENILMYNIPHEVTHYFQFANTPNVRKQNFQTINGDLVEQKIYVPSSLFEGSANTLGSAITVKHVGWYSDQMDWHVGRMKSRGFIAEVRNKEEAIKLLYDADSWLPKKNSDPEISYIFGQLQYEYLIAKYGLRSYFDLFKNIEKYGNYDVAIIETIGKSKSDFYSESAEYVMEAFNKVKN